MVGQAWDHASNTTEKRGKLIRYMLSHVGYNPTKSDPLDASAIEGEDMGNYTGDNHPSRTDINTFIQRVKMYYREYLDNLAGTTFLSTITDSQIGVLYGDDVGDPIKGSAGASFVSSVGSGAKIGSIKNTTGIDHAEFKRKLMKTAISSPDRYIDEYNKALDKIDEEILEVYKTSLNKYVGQYSYPIEKAEEMARKDMEGYKQMLLRQFELVYKKHDYDEASKKIFKSN